METGTERPRAGDPPQLDSPLAMLKELLEIERKRLAVAVRIEEERKIVFPETTIIIRDIQKLMAAIEAKEAGGKATTETSIAIDDILSNDFTGLDL